MTESCSASWMVVLVNVELADRVIDVEFAVGGGVVFVCYISFGLAQRSVTSSLAWVELFWECSLVHAMSRECVCAYRRSAPSRCVQSVAWCVEVKVVLRRRGAKKFGAVQRILATWQSYIQVKVQIKFKHGCQNTASLTDLLLRLNITGITRLEDLGVLSKKQLTERTEVR